MKKRILKSILSIAMIFSILTPMSIKALTPTTTAWDTGELYTILLLNGGEKKSVTMKGDTIQLLQDINLTSSLTIYPNDTYGDIKLDLNGHQLRTTSSISVSKSGSSTKKLYIYGVAEDNNDGIWLDGQYSNLSIDNNCVITDAQVYATNSSNTTAVIKIIDGNVTLTNSKITGSNNPYLYIANSSVVNIDGCTFRTAASTVDGACQISGNSTYYPTVNITNSEFQSNGNSVITIDSVEGNITLDNCKLTSGTGTGNAVVGLLNIKSGYATVLNSTISSSLRQTAVYLQGGTLESHYNTISGSLYGVNTVSGDGYFSMYGGTCSGTGSDGAGIFVTSNATVEIQKGTVSGTLGAFRLGNGANQPIDNFNFPITMNDSIAGDDETQNIATSGMAHVTPETEIHFSLVPAALSISKTVYTYDATQKSPTVTAKDYAGNKLVKNTDYTITVPTGRKAVGTYKYTVKYIGKYARAASKTISFKINPKKAVISSITPGTKKMTVKMSTKVSATGGGTYQIQYKKSGTTTWKSTTTTAQSKTISSLTKGKKYNVRARAYKTVNGTRYNGAWSTTKTSAAIK